MRTIVKRAAIIGTAVAVTTGAGIAYAAWVANGSGTATAKAMTAKQLTTEAEASTSATLYPGATGDVTLRISNPNPYPVAITTVSGSGAITASGGIGTCTTTGVTFTDQTGLTLNLAANQTRTFTLAGAVTMSNASEDGCQGATFTIPVTMTGASSAN